MILAYPRFEQSFSDWYVFDRFFSTKVPVYIYLYVSALINMLLTQYICRHFNGLVSITLTWGRFYVVSANFIDPFLIY